MSIKIAVISDIHYAKEVAISARQGQIGNLLLQRAVGRLNATIRPDVTLLLGDVLDDPESLDAPELLTELKQILDSLESAQIVIPGNHDLPEERFYQIVDRPPDFLDLAGHRFICFLDPEEPNWNARRLPEDLERMSAARSGYDGPIVALQHVPVFPPGTSDCCYGYTNIDEVMAATRADGIALSISGHYHPGTELIRQGEHAFFVAGALCESPFRFFVVEVNGDDIQVETYSLESPSGPGVPATE